MSRGRQKQPWITDPKTHPRRYVSLRVAARYLEVDRRTLNKFLKCELLAAVMFGDQRKIAVSELIAYEARQAERRA